MPALIFAQNISGYWQGVAYQPIGGSTDCYPVTIYFVQNGTSLSGTSYTYEAGTPYFAEMEVQGSISGNSINYKEPKILDKKDAPGFEWCLGYGNLNYNPATETIKGTLYGNTPSGFACQPATLEVYRLQIFSPLKYCKAGTYTLQVEGKNVKWYADKDLKTLLGTGNSLTKTINQSTIFYVTQTTQYCSTQSPAAEVQVVISNLKLANATLTQPDCTGKNGKIETSATGGEPPYLFSLDGSNFQPQKTFTNLTAGNYTLTLRDAQGCESTQTLTLTAPQPPLVSASASPADCGKQNGSATANATGGKAPFQFVWSTGATTQKIDNLTVGQFQVTVTDANGCSATASATVNGGGNVPEMSFQTKPAHCGTEVGEIYTSINGGKTPYSFDWNTGSHAKDLQKLAGGIYRVTVTDANGCSVLGEAEVKSSEKLQVSFDLKSVLLEKDSSQILTPKFNRATADGLKFEWSPAEGLSCTDCENPIASPSKPTRYILVATDANGCNGTAEIEVLPFVPKIEKVFLPNAFSPNDDGWNDEYETHLAEGVEFQSLQIFDRWGELVFETKNQAERWNGKFRGKNLQSDVFIAILKFKERDSGKENLKTTSVALMR